MSLIFICLLMNIPKGYMCVCFTRTQNIKVEKLEIIFLCVKTITLLNFEITKFRTSRQKFYYLKYFNIFNTKQLIHQTYFQ